MAVPGEGQGCPSPHQLPTKGGQSTETCHPTPLPLCQEGQRLPRERGEAPFSSPTSTKSPGERDGVCPDGASGRTPRCPCGGPHRRGSEEAPSGTESSVPPLRQARTSASHPARCQEQGSPATSPDAQRRRRPGVASHRTRAHAASSGRGVGHPATQGVDECASGGGHAGQRVGAATGTEVGARGVSCRPSGSPGLGNSDPASPGSPLHFTPDIRCPSPQPTARLWAGGIWQESPDHLEGDESLAIHRARRT